MRGGHGTLQNPTASGDQGTQCGRSQRYLPFFVEPGTYDLYFFTTSSAGIILRSREPWSKYCFGNFEKSTFSSGSCGAFVFVPDSTRAVPTALCSYSEVSPLLPESLFEISGRWSR